MDRGAWQAMVHGVAKLQYSWASLVTERVKNLPAMRETWVRSLGWEDPLEEGMASILAWRIPMDRGTWWASRAWRASLQVRTESDTTEAI